MQSECRMKEIFHFPATHNTCVFCGSTYGKTGIGMKRLRIPTKFLAVEVSEGNGKAGHVDLSTEEESPDESDSESEKTLLSSHRKSSSVTRKRARSESLDSESDPEEPNSSPALETPLRAVSSNVSFVSTVDCHSATSILTFSEVLDYVRINCFSWQTYVDHSQEMILLYRLNVSNPVPAITVSVTLRFVARLNSISTFVTSKKISANVCVDGKQLDDAFVISAIKKSEICAKEDIVNLLKHVDVERLRDEILVASQPPASKMPSYRPPSSSSQPQLFAQPSQSTTCIPLIDRSSASRTSKEFASPASAFLQSIRADFHREKCRNTVLFRTCESSNGSLLLESPVRKSLRSERLSTPEMSSISENGYDGPSLGSSVTGLSFTTLEETDQEPVEHFWHEPGDNRARLVPHDLYISAWYLTYLQRKHNLRSSQRRTMSQAIHYGWDLICHMLGGPAVICQRLKNAQSDQEKIGSALLGGDIYKIFIEHVEHSFFSRKERAKEAFSLEGFTEAVNKKLFDLPSAQTVVSEKVCTKSKRSTSESNSDGEDGDYDVTTSKNRKEKSNGFMYGIHSKNTCKASGRVRLSSKHPDFFIDKDKLEEIQRLHGLGMTDRKGIQGFAWYCYMIIEYLLGGEVQLRESRMKLESGRNGIIRMVGRKLFDVVIDHCHEKYPGYAQPNGNNTPFKNWCAYYVKHTGVRDERVISRNALASVLFVDNGLESAPQPLDLPPCDARARYWSTPHPSRIQLHEDHDYYVDKISLAEYQRYFGPESALGEVAFTEYTFLVLQYLVGGEEVVMVEFRNHPGTATSWLKTHEKNFLKAYYAHVVHLFPAANLNDRTVRSSLQKSLDAKLRLIRKGKLRLPKGVLYIDGKIPEQVTLLDQHEYWRTPAEDRTQLRKGHNVYISTTFLHSAQDSHGPLSQDAASKKYAFVIMEHMLGGEEVVSRARNDYVFWQACKSMMRVDDVLALCLHAEETFHLSESLYPDKLFEYTKRRINDRRRDRSDRKQKWVAKYSLK